MKIKVTIKDGGKVDVGNAFGAHVIDDKLTITTKNSFNLIPLSHIVQVDFGDDPNLDDKEEKFDTCDQEQPLTQSGLEKLKNIHESKIKEKILSTRKKVRRRLAEKRTKKSKK